jgi:DNA-binding CsgD family transcriptional regulator
MIARVISPAEPGTISASQPDKGPISPRRVFKLLVLFRWPSLIPPLVAYGIAARTDEAHSQLTAALDALDHGVDGFVHKDIVPDDLVQVIRVVAAGKSYLGPEVRQALITKAESAEPHQVSLSSREKEVLALMSTAATYREIGEELFISEETVRSHAKNILAKLEQPNRTQAVIAAIRSGLISLD